MSTLSTQVTHLAGLVRAAIPRIHPGGRIIVGGVWGISHLTALLLRLVGLRRLSRFTRRLGTTATIGSALFFRVPDRVPPAGDGLVVAPADGVVSLITRAAPPAETGLGDDQRTRVSIFLSVLDVHVQFAPVAGTVSAVHYHPGQFLSADLDKASEVNERNSVVIRPAVGGQELVTTQIAGLIARRIVCDVGAGDQLTTGRVYGLIRFGSRLDVYLPEGAEPQVHLGQRAVGGETVLAALPGAKAAKAGGAKAAPRRAASKKATTATTSAAATSTGKATAAKTDTAKAAARKTTTAKANPSKTAAPKSRSAKADATAPLKAGSGKSKTASEQKTSTKTGTATNKAAGGAKPRTRRAASSPDEDGRA